MTYKCFLHVLQTLHFYIIDVSSVLYLKSLIKLTNLVNPSIVIILFLFVYLISFVNHLRMVVIFFKYQNFSMRGILFCFRNNNH